VGEAEVLEEPSGCRPASSSPPTTIVLDDAVGGLAEDDLRVVAGEDSSPAPSDVDGRSCTYTNKRLKRHSCMSIYFDIAAQLETILRLSNNWLIIATF